MTRKDYVAIAGKIAETAERGWGRPDSFMSAGEAGGFRIATAEVARELASVMERDNPRFDRERFLAACKVTMKSAPTVTK